MGRGRGGGFEQVVSGGCEVVSDCVVVDGGAESVVDSENVEEAVDTGGAVVDDDDEGSADVEGPDEEVEVVSKEDPDVVESIEVDVSDGEEEKESDMDVAVEETPAQEIALVSLQDQVRNACGRTGRFGFRGR